MLPLSDGISARRFPFVNVALIAARLLASFVPGGSRRKAANSHGAGVTP